MNSNWGTSDPWKFIQSDADVGAGYEQYGLATTNQEKPRGCISSSQCASGFACINGECVQLPDENGPSCLSGGSDYGAGACGGSSAGSIAACTVDTAGACITGTISGGGSCDSTEPSIPTGVIWNPPSNSGCDGFCDNWLDSFGTMQSGCAGQTCGACEECSIFGTCSRAADDNCNCGSPPPNQTIRCYRCDASGQWLATTCEKEDEKEDEEEKDECTNNANCVEDDVCVQNTESGTVTCEKVTQCGDLPDECEPASCDCHADCPPCYRCSADTGACEEVPDCGLGPG